MRHLGRIIHPRVVDFSNRFFSYADKGEMPTIALRDELLTLHSVIEDTASRVLISRYFDLGEAHFANLLV